MDQTGKPQSDSGPTGSPRRTPCKLIGTDGNVIDRVRGGRPGSPRPRIRGAGVRLEVLRRGPGALLGDVDVA
jgi:hypothetical protein